MTATTSENGIKRSIRKRLLTGGCAIVTVAAVAYLVLLQLSRVTIAHDTVIVFDSLNDDRALTMARPYSHEARYIQDLVGRNYPHDGFLYANWVTFEENNTAIARYGKRILVYDLATRQATQFGTLGMGRLLTAVWARPLPRSLGYIFVDAENILWLSRNGEKPVAVIRNTFGFCDIPDSTHILTLQRDWTLQKYDINTGRLNRLFAFTPSNDQVSYSARGDRLAILLNDRIVVIDEHGQHVKRIGRPTAQIGGIAWANDNVIVFTKVQDLYTDCDLQRDQ